MASLKIFKCLLICGIFHQLSLTAMAAISTFKLLSGDSIPLIGFGTYLIKGKEDISNSLDFSLEAGYRLIDTAYAYRNEKEIGEALKVLLPKYNLSRSDIFVTSKLPPSGLGPEKLVHKHIQESLNDLQLDYLDLYLIHWPGPSRSNSSSDQSKNNSVIRDETWQALKSAKDKGWVRNIGVSNYNVNHLNEVLENAHGVVPAVNQVEWHPLYHQDDLLALCKKHGIFLQAYSSLGGTRHRQELLAHPKVQEIAAKLKKTPAQLLLRWAVQQDIGIIPKSLKKEHIVMNKELDFEIPADQMKELGNLETKKFAWDPAVIP